MTGNAGSAGATSDSSTAAGGAGGSASGGNICNNTGGAGGDVPSTNQAVSGGGAVGLWTTGNQANAGSATANCVARGGNIGWDKETLQSGGYFEEYYALLGGQSGVPSIAPFNELIANKVQNVYWASSSTPYFYANFNSPSGSTSGAQWYTSSGSYWVQGASPLCGGDGFRSTGVTQAAGGGCLGSGGGAGSSTSTTISGAGGNGGILIFPVDMG